MRAMTELGWRSRLTLTTFYIIAGTLAAAHCSLLQNHCASPNSGSEHSWGISLTQDSRDSFIDSGCHSYMVAVGQMSVPSRASAHRVDSLQAMLDCYASLPFSASAELGRLASSCSACSFRGFNLMCSSERQVSSSAFSRGGESRCRNEASATFQTAPTSSMLSDEIATDEILDYPHQALRATWQHHQYFTPIHGDSRPIHGFRHQKSGHFHITTKAWNKMMHALWGNTTTTVTTKPVGRPKGTATASASAKTKAKGSLINKLDPSKTAKPTPPTPPRSKAQKEKKVTFASPGASAPASSPSGRERLIQLVGTALTSEPFAEAALTRYLGEVTMAGQDVHTEATELAKNLQVLGKGLQDGSVTNDIANSEFTWMSDYIDALEKALASMNKKKNASPSTKSILSPSVKSASPSGSTLMAKFFPEETVEYAKTQAFDYKAPDAGAHNNRHSAKFESLLRDGATKADYREWRLLSEAFVNTQAELKILESSVRDSLINALGAQTRQAVLAQFGSKLSSKRVSDLIHYLDMRYSFMASVEDTKIIEDFENCKRSTNMTLASFLATWKSSLTRASIAGYVPSSDVSNLLLSRAIITDAQTSRVVEDLRSLEATTGVKLRGEARHKAVYEALLKQAQVAEQVKLQRQTEKGPLFGKANANTTQVATADKKPKKRGRGKKTHVNTAEDSEAQPPKPPKKKTKTDPPASDPSPEASSFQAFADAFTGAFTAFAHGKGKGAPKGPPKGAPKGTPKGSPAGGGKGSFRKGGKKGKAKGRGKGKGGKGKGQFDSRNPNRLPPNDWDQSKGAWRCSACNAFNQHWKRWCSWCSQPKT